MTSVLFGIIAVALLYLLSILGWGGLLTRLLPSTGTFWQDLTARIVVGCSALYGMFILLSCVGRLNSIETLVITGLGVLLCCVELPDLARKAVAALSEIKSWQSGDYIVGILIGLFALLQLASGLTPLVFYDLQAYHFLAVSQFLNSGTLIHIPWNVLTNTPLAMQLTLGMSLSMENSGQVLKLLFTVLGSLTIVGIYEFIRPTGLRGALLAALCAVSFPEFLLMQTLGAVDLAIAGFLIFGAIWLRRAFAERNWQLALLAGLAFGLAAGSRYQAILLVSWIAIVVTAEAKLNARSMPIAAVIRPLFIAGCLTSLLVAPWLIRNYAHLGNPVFPLMQSMWNSTSEWSSFQTTQFNVAAYGNSLSAISWVQKTLAPVAALLVQPSNGLFGTGLLLAGLVGLGVSTREIRIASFLGLTGLVMWGLLRPEADVALLRHNAASLLFLLAATGAILGSERMPASAGRAIAIALSAGSMVIAVSYVQHSLPAAQSLVNPDARDGLRQANVTSWDAFNFINAKLSRSQHKVLLIGETRAFWLRVPYIAPSAFNGGQLDRIFGGNTNPDDWMRDLSHLGLTHLLVSTSELQRWHKQYHYFDLERTQAEKFNNWIHQLPKLFDDERGNVVFALANPQDLNEAPGSGGAE
jgi:hypothetical protein